VSLGNEKARTVADPSLVASGSRLREPGVSFHNAEQESFAARRSRTASDAEYGWKSAVCLRAYASDTNPPS